MQKGERIGGETSGLPGRILIYRIASLGDTIIVLPALRKVREAFPRAHIAILTTAPVSKKVAPLESIVGNMGIVDQIIHYPYGTRNFRELARVRRVIREGRFDMLISLAAARGLPSSVRDYLFFKSCGIPQLIGIPFRKRDLVRQPIHGTDRYESECARLLRRISAWGSVDLEDSRWWDLGLQESELAEARQIVDDAGVLRPYIAASMGTKVPGNDWGLENWRNLLSTITPAFSDLGLVLLGSNDEHARSEELLAAWQGPKANLCGKPSPRISAGILRDAALYLGHDSGPMHLAAAAGTRCVAVFALRNPPGQWFPLGPGHSIFYPRLAFDPSRTVDLEYQQRAILSISVSEVAAAVMLHLANPQRLQSTSSYSTNR